MRFTKMDGCGNDFIILEREETVAWCGSSVDFAELAVKLCSRHFSVGADGLIVFERTGKGCKIDFYNCDGTTAQLCGNGTRCAARYAYENGICGETQRIETGSGTTYARRIEEDVYSVFMPLPTQIRQVDLPEPEGKGVAVYVELGDPPIEHLVVKSSGIIKNRSDTAALRDTEWLNACRERARLLRYSKEFPLGANVNFCEKSQDGSLYVLTYERGVEDFTLACGSGVCAAAAADTLLYGAGALQPAAPEAEREGALEAAPQTKELAVIVPGGEMKVEIRYGTGSNACDMPESLILTAQCRLIAEGDVFL